MLSILSIIADYFNRRSSENADDVDSTKPSTETDDGNASGDAPTSKALEHVRSAHQLVHRSSIEKLYAARKRSEHQFKDEGVEVSLIAPRRRRSSASANILESVLTEFHLTNDTLHQMMSDMDREMDSGLIGGLDTSTIAMLPSFVPRMPTGKEKGDFLAMDLGGTNLRCLLMRLFGDDEEDSEPVTKSRNVKIPDQFMIGTGEELFGFIADALANFLEEKDLKKAGLPLGFTFSYPCDQTSLKSASLLRWTKGFNASGVEGNDVVEILEKAIEQRGDIKVNVVALMNDTVGTMISTALDRRKCAMGVIVGTGTNCAYMESVSKITKLKDANYTAKYDKMVIDTEWGGFGDHGTAEYIKTRFDKIIDERSVHPGVQSFDKLVAGMYLGELVRLVLEKLVHAEVLFDGFGSEIFFTPLTFHTKYISEILGDESGHMYTTRQILDELDIPEYTFNDLIILREVCMVVSRRSAHLAAAAIACVLNRVKLKKAIVGIDGSTYKFHPFYHSWVTDKVNQLLKGKCDVEIVTANDGSGKGAALVAAIAQEVSSN